MRMILAMTISVVLAGVAGAQQQSGRHFHRDTRMPQTPAAAPQEAKPADASATSHRVAPLRKLRSGRAWPLHHFRRMPEATAQPATGAPVDASANRSPNPRRGFWRPRG